MFCFYITDEERSKSMNQATESAHEPVRVSVKAVKTALERGEQPVFIDTRNSKAWQTSHEKLPGALRVPVAEVDRHLNEIPPDRPIVTYCT
jgi:rhodanese-related sulfurtransferase